MAKTLKGFTNETLEPKEKLEVAVKHYLQGVSELKASIKLGLLDDKKLKEIEKVVQVLSEKEADKIVAIVMKEEKEENSLEKLFQKL